jgi:hypothetical protein
MPFIYITTKLFEDSLICGCDSTDSVRYHLRANKVVLSLNLMKSTAFLGWRAVCFVRCLPS